MAFPAKDARRIFNTIKILADDPFTGDIQKMEGEEQVWRRRIGSYRIMYELIPTDRIVHVFRAERRTSQTYRR